MFKTVPDYEKLFNECRRLPKKDNRMPLKPKKLKGILILTGIVLCALSLYLYHKDTSFNDQWTSAILWVGGWLIPLGILLFQQQRKSEKSTNDKEAYLLLIITLLATILRFYKLTEIPLLNGDEARDAGLIPERFLRGEIKDLFGYGIYGIPNMFFAVASIPHLFFGQSILSIRFFSALFGVLAVVLTFYLTKNLFDKKTALISALLLSCYHIHVQFSRSEFINNFDSFWAVLIAFFLTKTAKNIRKENCYTLTLGIASGLGTHFYQGIRAFIATANGLFLIDNLIGLIKKQIRNLGKIVLWLIGFLMGLGPSIVVITQRTNEFLNTGTAGRPLPIELGLIKFLRVLPEKALHSFGAIIHYPIDFHYQYGGPLLGLPTSIFFLLGILFLIAKPKKKANILMLSWIIGVVFCNSTIQKGMNFAHRLLSLAPALMIITAVGIEKATKKISRKTTVVNSLIVGLTLLICSLNLKKYFIDEVWKNAYDINTKVGTIAGHYTKQLPKPAKVYFLNSKRMGWQSNPAWEYLAPNATVLDLKEPFSEDIIKNEKNRNYKLAFIALPERKEDLQKIKSIFPKGKTEKHYYKRDLLFISYEL